MSPFPGQVVFRPYKGKCPRCKGRVKVVQATFWDFPQPKRGECLYSRWRRDGMDEDFGICTKGPRE